MTFNDENIDLNPNLSEVAKNIKSIQTFFSGMDYFYGDVEQAKKDYVNPPTTEVMGFPPLLWVAAF